MPQRDPRVSDHALLRYMERVMGLDLDAVRDRILTPENRAAIAAGATAILIEGERYPVSEGVIVTTLHRTNGKYRGRSR